MITAEFFGGPADGKTQALPSVVDKYRFAIPPEVKWIDPEGQPEPMKAAEYELVRDQASGLPSLTDDGRHRYEFKEISAW